MSLRRHIRLCGILALTAFVAAPQTRDPHAVWLFIKNHLIAPDGDQFFDENLRDTLIPHGVAPFLQGTVVSAVFRNGNGRILLAMADSETAEVTLLVRGNSVRGKLEPKRGTKIQFEGVGTTYTREPFMVTFVATTVNGLHYNDSR